MISNTNKLFKIAEFLDQKGKYALSDKVDNLIKISQNLLSTLPGDYEQTGSPVTGNPFVDSIFRNMSDTAAGSEFAGGGMYDRFSPYKSKFGPTGPGLLPTLTPAQFAELSKTEKGRQYIAQMQLSGGMQAQNFMNLSNVGLISFGKFIAQNLAPGVAQERKQEFVNSVLPGTMRTQVANILTHLPINQWESKLSEFNTVASQYPEYSFKIKTLVNQSVQSALDNLKYQDINNYNRIVTDPKYKQFAKKFGVQ